MQIRLAELLEFIAKRYAKSRVLEEIDHQIDAVRRARRVGGRLRDFIRKEGLEPLYDRGRNKGDYEAFAVLLQQLKVDPHALLEIDRRLPPREPWPEGRELIVFVGEKRVNSHTKLPRRGVGARDAQALAFLVEFLRITIGVEVPLIFHPLEDDRPDQAEKLFKKLLSKHKSGMFVALGSELVNPVARQMADKIFEKLPATAIPARFQWAYPPEPLSRLSLPGACASEEEGMVLTDSARHIGRTSDAEILAALQDRHSSRARGPGRKYPDCGILAMRVAGDQLFMLAAGHGGCGTEAAVGALTEQAYLASRLLADEDGLPKGCLCEPIRVQRKKPTWEELDDLDFSREYGKGWDFCTDRS